MAMGSAEGADAQRGRIKSVLPERGFGFITDSDGRDRFFHVSQLFGVAIERLMPGDVVTFRPTQRSQGLAAVNVWPAMKD